MAEEARSNELQKHVEILPQVGPTPVLDERTTLAAFALLQLDNEHLVEAARAQIDVVEASFEPKLPKIDTLRRGQRVISAEMLRAIILRSIIAGAAQTAYGIGGALLQARELEDSMNGDNQGDGGETPPAT